ncbi:MAG: Unknown protein [uncultured Sulfurovum sp.]|uniref:Uncharacterized protein n=1 Tax=uncultured Sulfurovum sp. TaxID=269237 RepID=A0A6S6SH19_9BACT|nr:MAG: Unknown protein [uncultured Sulfurovum sp.]
MTEEEKKVAIAKDPNTPIETLEDLLFDLDGPVQINLAKNPNVTLDMLKRMHQSIYTINAFALETIQQRFFNKTLSKELYLFLKEDETYRIAWESRNNILIDTAWDMQNG